MLARNQQQWSREKLLSRRVSGGITWTPRNNGTDGRRSSSPSVALISFDDGERGGGGGCNDSSKENNNSLVGNNNRVDASKTPSKKTARWSGGGKKIYIDPHTVTEIKNAIDNLPLPATLYSICLELKTNDAVLDAHADAILKAINADDDMEMKKFEILGPYREFNSMLSLSSPSKQRDERKEEFKIACLSLMPRGSGSKRMLNEWEEVKEELEQIFHLSVLGDKSVQENREGSSAEEEGERTRRN